MPPRKQLTAAAAVFALLAPGAAPILARNRKADKLLAQAQAAEAHGQYDQAVILAEQAVGLDPADSAYMLELRRTRFESAAAHVTHAQKIRSEGKLAEALAEFEKAYATDPANDNAEQEIRRTRQMIEREEKRSKDGQPTSPGDAGLTPADRAHRDNEKRFEAMLPLPQLTPLNPLPLNLKMNNQKPRVLFDTIGKLAGINVLFDPDYDSQQQAARPQSIELNNSTLEDALEYVSVATKSFWKPLSPNTIFVSVENPAKHREYDEQVVKVFYLNNVTSPQELQEIITTLRTVVEVSKLFQYTAQNALILRAEANRMALAEKIIADLDKPKSEVVIDVLVMEVNSVHMRKLAAAFAPNGISTQIMFTPRSSIVGGTTTTTTTGTGTGITGTGTGTGGTTTTANTSVPLSALGKINFSDFSLSNIPNALIEAVLNDTGTRVLQAPQIRAVDNFKAILKIGDKVPTATGSFQPGVGGVGINPLVNTQFSFIDTGVNLEITPRVHENKEVSLHVDVDISQVKDHVDLGGISQPVIGQRRATVDVRLRDGQVNMIGGLIQKQDSKLVTGVPFLSSIPGVRRLFTSENIEKDSTELLITMVPHIVRSNEVTETNLKGIESGTEQVPHLHYAAAVRAPIVEIQPQGPVPAAPPATAVAPPTVPATVSAPAPGPLPAPPATAPPATNEPSTTAPPLALSFSPAAVETSVGSSVTVALRAENAADLVGATSQFKYDPKVLQMVSVATGELLERAGQPLTPSKNIVNSTGDASVSIARDPSSPGVGGSGALMTVVFQAVGKGTTTVTVPDISVRLSTGRSAAPAAPSLTVHVQ